MSKYSLPLLVMAVLLSCVESNTETKEQPEESNKLKISLNKIWESDTVYTTAESAIYDAKRDVIYVSNIEEGPWETDGKGSIGQLSVSGEVVNARWIEGLNAPKGLGIVDDYLYVTDLQTLVEIDIPNNKINQRYEVAGASGINDITTSPDGVVYISDSKVGKIFKFENGELTQIKDSLASSNGIFYDNDRLLVGTWGDEKVNMLELNSNTLSDFSIEVAQPDGIEADGKGGYFVTSWKGLIHYVHPDGSHELLLDTSADEIGAADIDFVQEKNLLLVPTFFHNTVAAYEVKFE